jgi:hypothetical protein
MLSLMLAVASFLPLTNLEKRLVGQMSPNSRITLRKLALFQYSLLLFGFGVLMAATAMTLVAMLV